MLTESRKEFNEVLDTYEVPLAQFKADEWKRAVVSHAHEVEALQGTSSRLRLQDEIEMLVSTIEQTTQSMNKLAGSSKQRTQLRSKISADKAKLSSQIQRYNEETQGVQGANLQCTCSVSEVIKGNFPWGRNADTPIRIKRIIVEKSEIAKRWDEEVALVKKEMANFIAYYMDVSIPHLTKIAEELQGKLDNLSRPLDARGPPEIEEASVESENEMIGSYRTVSVDARIIEGSWPMLKKGSLSASFNLSAQPLNFKQHYLVVTMRIR